MMQAYVNNELVIELTDLQCQVICNDINEDDLVEDMNRRLSYIWSHKYEQCMKRLRATWYPILKSEGVESIPTSDDDFATLIFARPDYKSKKQRDQA